MREDGWVITSVFYFVNLVLYTSKEHPFIFIVQVYINVNKITCIVPLALRLKS